MSDRCSVCRAGVAQLCALGRVRTRLCDACMHGAGLALAAWTVRRMREVEKHQQRAEDERLAALANSDALEAEMLPRVRRKAG
jgi:hypothetical protein